VLDVSEMGHVSAAEPAVSGPAARARATRAGVPRAPQRRPRPTARTPSRRRCSRPRSAGQSTVRRPTDRLAHHHVVAAASRDLAQGVRAATRRRRLLRSSLFAFGHRIGGRRNVGAGCSCAVTPELSVPVADCTDARALRPVTTRRSRGSCSSRRRAGRAAASAGRRRESATRVHSFGCQPRASAGGRSAARGAARAVPHPQRGLHRNVGARVPQSRGS